MQEGCHFDRSSQWAFLPALAKALKAAGAGGVALATSDETNIADADKSFKAMTPAALKLVTQVRRERRWREKKNGDCFLEPTFLNHTTRTPWLHGPSFFFSSILLSHTLPTPCFPCLYLFLFPLD